MENSPGLFSDKKLLGQNYEMLGKNVGKDLRKQKVFISYEGKKWNVVKLNLIQQLLRKVFGFYKSTHLEHVIKHWAKYKVEKTEYKVEKTDYDQVLDQKLRTLWKKTYPKKELPHTLYGLVTINLIHCVM